LIFAFFTVDEKKLKNLVKNACVWKKYRIFVTLLEDVFETTSTRRINERRLINFIVLSN